MFRKKRTCQNVSPDSHPSYAGKRCEKEEGHSGMCRISLGMFKHYWNPNKGG